ICEVIVGKNQAVKLSVACLLARGHLLIEDIPGVGKPTLSQALSRSLGLAFQRIALMHGREMLLPEDIQAVGMAVMAHRLGHDLEQSGQSGRTLADNLLHSVPVPGKKKNF